MATKATWIDPEERCYPGGGMHRRARVKVDRNPHNPVALPYGEIRMVRAGIPDTFYTIPAVLRYRGMRVRGFLSHPYIDGEGTTDMLTFTPEANPDHCPTCAPGAGCRK